MFKSAPFLSLAVLLYAAACQEKPAEESTSWRPSSMYHYVDINFKQLKTIEKVYVPVYSDIYHFSGERRQNLTATLSVRNTSLRDTMYVHQVDYFDSQGKMLREYLEKDVVLLPMQSIEFVVEHRENEGGAGASFLVDWGCDSDQLRPVIQAVMISTVNQQGISFVTEGVTVERMRNAELVIPTKHGN
ncbi:MAG: DUF3124 domain-containing protein [Saprospiraceae bacterium]|nr:DUF3124 domain-containing protein [Saprospiraceae bacterium]